jgi:DNA-directed RNA polymerase subunit RPC12/RpoP
VTVTKVRTRVLACPNCGARLRWDSDAPVIECRYCQTHVMVETGSRTTLATDVVSKRAPPRALWIILSVVVLAGVTSMAVVANRRIPSTPGAEPSRTSTAAEVAATPIAATPQQVADRHGVKVHGTSVNIAMSGNTFTDATFHWDKDHLDHVSSISLRPRENAGELTDVIARARGQIGRRLRPAATGGYQFFTKGVSFSLSSTLHIGGQPKVPGWKEGFAAMWTVMKGAALGTSDKLDDRARRDLLNLSYPLSTLTAIGFDVEVDGAERELHRVAPGADSKGDNHQLGIDHPWFETAWLRWENKPGGKWTGVTLYFPKELDFKAQSEPIIACLRPVLGEPKKLVDDHLAGTFSLQYPARGGRPWVHIGGQSMSIYPHHTFGEPATAAGLHGLIAALAGCGK